MLEHLEKSDRIQGMKTPLSTRPSSDYRVLGENAGDRDNQQERLRRITWLTAMLECEGTFTFQYNEQIKEGRIYSHIQPRVIFVNSDLKLVDAVEKTMRYLGMKKVYRRDGIRGGIGRRPKSEVQVNGFRSLPLLYLLRPFMVGTKTEVVDCMIQFVEYRKSLKNGKQKYGDLEFDLLAQVRKINSGHWHRSPKFSSVSSTTVRQRRAAQAAKIQSELYGDIESLAEMSKTLPN